MYTELQFSPGFMTLNDNGRDVARLDDRQLADVGIVRGAKGDFERDGVVIEVPSQKPRLLEILTTTLSFVSGRAIRHA